MGADVRTELWKDGCAAEGPAAQSRLKESSQASGLAGTKTSPAFVSGIPHPGSLEVLM